MPTPRFPDNRLSIPGNPLTNECYCLDRRLSSSRLIRPWKTDTDEPWRGRSKITKENKPIWTITIPTRIESVTLTRIESVTFGLQVRNAFCIFNQCCFWMKACATDDCLGSKRRPPGYITINIFFFFFFYLSVTLPDLKQASRFLPLGSTMKTTEKQEQNVIMSFPFPFIVEFYHYMPLVYNEPWNKLDLLSYHACNLQKLFISPW